MATEDRDVFIILIFKEKSALVAWIFPGGIGMNHAGQHSNLMALRCPHFGHFIESGAASILFFQKILMDK
jgi:hypothetical protein